MKMNKVLSIVVPSYNMEAYLSKCLSSLIVDSLLMDRFEVLVVNDGSKDRTSEIAHEFAAKWPQTFTVIDKENGHYGSCINEGLKVAKGTYIKVLDADDWFVTENFSAYLKFLIEEVQKGSAGADLVVNDFEFVSKDHCSRKSYPFVRQTAFDVTGFNFRNGHDVWMHALAYRTQKLRDIGYVQLTGLTHTDIQWLHLPMTTVERIAGFPYVLYEYSFLREGNTSTPDEFYRTYAVQVKILKKMIVDYERVRDRLDAKHETYLRNHVIFRAFRAYQVYVMERSPLLDQTVIADFDSYLKINHLWLYQDVLKFRYLNKFQYGFIKDWRKKKRITWMILVKFWLLRQAVSLYGLIRK